MPHPPHSFSLLIFLLFLAASVFLTVRHEALLEEGSEDLVTAGFTAPADPNNFQFFVRHEAGSPRLLTLRYQYADASETTETLTLLPKETRLLMPAAAARTITIRYQDSNNQEQILTLYKK